jgi:hypothetical protein
MALRKEAGWDSKISELTELLFRTFSRFIRVLQVTARAEGKESGFAWTTGQACTL